MAHYKKQQITIFPTSSCNMRCLYCVAAKSMSSAKNKVIDLDFAKKGIQDYFSDDIHHQIRFYSNGEPTCEMGIIKECLSYGQKLIDERKRNKIPTKELISEIQTNCIFDEDTVEWIAQNINYVWVSIDGWPEIQNKYRKIKDGKNSSDIVIKNIKKMLAIKNEITNRDSFVGVRVTIVEETVDKQIELIRYFHGLGITEICSEPCFKPVDHKNRNKEITLVNLKKYIYNFVEAWRVAQDIGVTYMNSFMVNFDESVTYACRTCLPTPHLTVDGYVSACDLGFHGDTLLKDLIYGEYNPEKKEIEYWSNNKKKLQSRNCQNIPACHGCEIAKYCGGGCLGRSYHETGDFYGVIDDYCWATKFLAHNLDRNKITFKHLHP